MNRYPQLKDEILGRGNLLCEQPSRKVDVRRIRNVDEIRWYRRFSARHETDRQRGRVAWHRRGKIIDSI